MILISSAAYVEREFQLEFGALPPALLPVGNIRLFELQIRALRKNFANEKIVLSLPKTHILNFRDKKILESFNVDIIYNEDGLSLGESIASVVSHYIDVIDNIRLIHGDTLVDGLVDDLDCIGISEAKDDHHWEVDQNSSVDIVWCGYFSFSSAKHLLNLILNAKGDFVSAVRSYDTQKHLLRFKPAIWYDFGHISTYFQSRSKITTERSFNSLHISDGSLVKSGAPIEKIKAEYSWFKNIDDDLLVYVPQLTHDEFDFENKNSYRIEYLPLPPLNEVFVHGSNSPRFWNKIFTLCDGFLRACEKNDIGIEGVEKVRENSSFLIKAKPKDRLHEYSLTAEYSNFDFTNILNGKYLPSINIIVDECVDRLLKKDMIYGVSHGDFCLSNILFDSRTQRIKVIDPRGLDYFGNETLYGDLRYDVAKLSHSIVGLYDHIIAGSFELEFDFSGDQVNFIFEIHQDENIKKIQDIFRSRIFIDKISCSDVMPLTILLFLSMLPLHSDQPVRQMAFIANALRLYLDMISMES